MFLFISIELKNIESPFFEKVNAWIFVFFWVFSPKVEVEWWIIYVIGFADEQLITINKIWSFNEIFLWYLRPTRQKNVPKKSETNKESITPIKLP